MTQHRIRIGVIGANPEQGWSPLAHLPALRALPEYELAAICTAHPDTARASAEKFGVPMAFHDPETMLRQADLDAVAVVVRVPKHYALARLALEAGKHVYVEWPLGASLKESRELAALARGIGVQTIVGLQGRCSPELARLSELVQEGYAGDLIACHMTQFAQGVLERPSHRTWQRDHALGATTLTIVSGHALDYFCTCVGEFSEVSAVVTTQVKQWLETDTGRLVDVTAPDNVLISGRLANGATASVHVASVPWHGSGFSIQVFGREGTLAVTQVAPGYGWMGGLRLTGGRRGDRAVGELPIPERLTALPPGVPPGPPENIARLYMLFAESIRTGRPAGPDFDAAVARHTLLEAVQASSDKGMRQPANGQSVVPAYGQGTGIRTGSSDA